MEHFQRPDGIYLKKICGEYFLVADRRMQKRCPVISQINETAARIFELLGGGASVQETAEQITLEYDIDPSLAEADTRRLCRELAENGFLIRE